MNRSLANQHLKINAKTKILVVDDHPLFRDGLAQLINRQTDMICCGQADSAAATRIALVKLKPDLILLDLRLGTGDALDLIKELKAQSDALRILIVSQYDQLVYAERALRAGANGYVIKSDVTDQVLVAIRSVLEGNLYVSQRLSMGLLTDILARKPAGTGRGIPSLTNREFQIFEMIGTGMRTGQIATSLHLSPKTVETYREHIKHKLNLPDAPALLQRASDWMHRQTDLPSSPPPAA